MTRLEGGFVNGVECTKRGVQKTYLSDKSVGYDPTERFFREKTALNSLARTTDIPTPAAYDIDPNIPELTVEYIHSDMPPLDSAIDMMPETQREAILYDAGRILRGIHSSIPLRSPEKALGRFMKQLDRSVDAAQLVLMDNGIDPNKLYTKVQEGIEDNEAVRNAGATRIHRDYWLNNLLYRGSKVVGVIDWEMSGIGSPYEDFSIVNLWIEREHGDAEGFWDGYGEKPDLAATETFVLARCTQMLATARPHDYANEPNDGFYHNKVRVIGELMHRI